MALRVVPETRKCSVYEVFALAVKGTVVSIVATPFTFFWMTRVLPSIYALYQLLPSVQRKREPKLLFKKLSIDPLIITSEFATAGPSTAL